MNLFRRFGGAAGAAGLSAAEVRADRPLVFVIAWTLLNALTIHSTK
ncbi:UNVERIFIED_ORG: hypothetical protein GGD58_000301 [Rhizobium pisi]